LLYYILSMVGVAVGGDADAMYVMDL
jgi:hypothetical protein